MFLFVVISSLLANVNPGGYAFHLLLRIRLLGVHRVAALRAESHVNVPPETYKRVMRTSFGSIALCVGYNSNSVGAPTQQEVTRLLVSWSKGDQKALEELTPLVYAELRRLAGRFLRRERSDHTLQSTALVHEAFLRLIDQRSVQWQNRAHFFGVAAQLIRRILVDYARSRQTAKRGADAVKLSLDDAMVVAEKRDLDLVALDDALNNLARLDPQQSRIVELRFFTGLSIEETAEVLGVSPATVKRDWVTAKALLYRELSGQEQQ
jgi:RNA polymerase sigma factor (TIGR02999 family)